jgi:predicted RNA-binding protein YlqC (UPF0109 family)
MMNDHDEDYEDTYNQIDPNAAPSRARDRDDGDDDAGNDDADDAGNDDGGSHNSVAAPSASAVLEYLARSVVDDPDGVDVDIDDGGNRVSLEVRVSDGDMGRVIGKRGRVANAIRTVVRAAAAEDGAEVDVEFVD